MISYLDEEVLVSPFYILVNVHDRIKLANSLH